MWYIPGSPTCTLGHSCLKFLCCKWQKVYVTKGRTMDGWDGTTAAPWPAAGSNCHPCSAGWRTLRWCINPSQLLLSLQKLSLRLQVHAACPCVYSFLSWDSVGWEQRSSHCFSVPAAQHNPLHAACHQQHLYNECEVDTWVTALAAWTVVQYLNTMLMYTKRKAWKALSSRHHRVIFLLGWPGKSFRMVCEQKPRGHEQ